MKASTTVSGTDFLGGDSTVGQLGWKTATVYIPASQLVGPGTIRLFITDVGDLAWDSVALIDDIELT